MSHTYLKTTYEVPSDGWGSTEEKELYVHHNHSCDSTVFYNSDGSVADLSFIGWSPGKDKQDAVLRLLYPYKGEWGNSELKEGVKHCTFSTNFKSK